MLIRNFIILILLFGSLLTCTKRQPTILTQSIFLFKDKDGLYLFDPVAQTEKLVYKTNNNQVFLDQPYELSNNILTFGFRGEKTLKEKGNYELGENYYTEFYSINLNTNKTWLSKKVLYDVMGHDSLKIKIVNIDTNHKTTVYVQKAEKLSGSSSSYKGIMYNDSKPRFFSSHSIGDKTVFSSEGNIYYINKLDTTLLVKFDGHFDMKFGSGYFEPRLDPKGEYVIFSYLPGFLNMKEKTSLQKINIKDKDIELIKNGDFSNPAFSKDGNFLLFQRNESEGLNNTWASEIYLLDLTTLNEKKISTANSFQWKE